MYDELIKRLRECTAEQNGEKTLWHQAADAIKELLAEREENYADSWKMTFEVERDTHRWIPVTERLPEENDVVLITDSLDVGTGYLVHGYGWISLFDDIETSHVSHWMPLPQPPEDCKT